MLLGSCNVADPEEVAMLELDGAIALAHGGTDVTRDDAWHT